MLTKTLRHKLSLHSIANLTRKRFVIKERNNTKITIDSKKLINFCSNDYLNIASHPQIKRAFIDGINKYGFGSSSSNLISGYYHSHRALEEKFAEFLQRDKALLFNSGYHANLGVITTLTNRNSTIIADRLCHASIIDSILLSQANHLRYKHNDLADATRLLAQQNKIQKKFLITEGVFSMEGDITPLNEFANLAKKNNTTTIVDDAHSIGVLGKNGEGTCEHFNLNQTDIACLITPLGKALGGVGAIVSGSHEFIETLIQFARTYAYTTALPPAISYAELAALEIINKENWHREKLQKLIKVFIKQAQIRNLPLVSSDPTPIKSILIGDNKSALLIQKKMLEKGFFISCIRPPTVPKNASRIRITLNCRHTEKQIINLLDCIAEHHEQNHKK
jgi:8-amino-7-oxononanoate synthase